MAVNHPIKLAILWHMHQPDYRDPHSSVAAAPWVRLRAIKDYLDMLMLATEHENIKVTFNLVPSLIEQFNHYLNGGSDNHLELTLLNPGEIGQSHRHEILDNFFKCHLETMIKPYPRYFRLFLKWQNSKKDNFQIGFSDDEIRDAQVWSNLTWVDPLFRAEAPLKSLFAKGEGFTELDKKELIQWQKNHIGKIIPCYQKMLQQERIDISFSPYFHPILPLLCDSYSAREALPDIKLPMHRFQHPEDARMQIKMSMAMYEDLFQKPLTGLWPSEGSVSEEALGICAECGIKWVAGDEQVLYRSLLKSGMNASENHPYAVYQHSSGIKMFFRDHVVSDKIGFVYSGWDPENAAADFVSHIKNARFRLSNSNEEPVVPVILDGENSWEFYKNDGHEFLKALYKKISQDNEISTVTMLEAANGVKPRPLKSVFAGSWIDHNFRIWIGHEEDNTGWDYLKSARDFLTNFEKLNPGYDKSVIESCWREIYIAEGSDWFWWYGDEHRGPDNYLFDRMFRNHLIRIYELLGSDIPEYLRLPIITQKYEPVILMPDALLTPHIDGHISHFYEWFGAGKYQCLASDTTMHRVFRLATTIFFSFDHDFFYLRVDFADSKTLKSLDNLSIVFNFLVPEEKSLTLQVNRLPFQFEEKGKYVCALSDILEIGVERKFLWTEGFGKLAFRMEIRDGNKLIEKWPAEESIRCPIPEKHKELFWHQ